MAFNYFRSASIIGNSEKLIKPGIYDLTSFRLVPSLVFSLTDIKTAHSTSTTLSSTMWSSSVSGVPVVQSSGTRHIVVAATCRDSNGLTDTSWLNSLTVNGIACNIFKQYSAYNGAAIGIVKLDASGTLNIVGSGSVIMEGGYHFTVWVIDGASYYTAVTSGFSSIINNTSESLQVNLVDTYPLGVSAFYCGATSNSTNAATISALDGKTWSQSFALDTGSTEFSSSFYSNNYSDLSFSISVNNFNPANGAAGVLTAFGWG